VRAEYIALTVIIAIVIGVVLYYWWIGYQQPAGQLVFSVDSVTLTPGSSTTVWLSYRPVEGYTGSITVSLSVNTPYITVYPSTVTLDPGESASIRITASSAVTPGTYTVTANGDGITAVLTVVVTGAPGGGVQATTLKYKEAPIAWKLESGTLVQAYQKVPNPSPYSDLIYRGKVKLGSVVRLYVKLYPVDGDWWLGDLKIEIRADVPGRPDYTLEEHIANNVYIDGKGWVELPITFTPPQETGVDLWCYINPAGHCIRQYFFKIWYNKNGQWILLYDPQDYNTRPSIEAES